MLELLVRQGVPDRARMPVSAEMLDGLREVLADAVEGGYDVDAALFHIGMAVLQLETAAMERQAQLLNLETRILQAGLPLRAPD